jgi:uncharacterized membrane protein
MSKNESNLDRILRVAAAAVTVVVAIAVGASSVIGVVLLAVGAILVVTAAVGFCPLYRLLGLSTDKGAPKVSTHV